MIKVSNVTVLISWNAGIAISYGWFIVWCLLLKPDKWR